MADRDYYADLGVARDASTDDIGRAFRRLAAKHHPDRNPGDKVAEEKFKKIADAYQVLSDPKTRAAYDRGGQEQVTADTGFRGFNSTEDVFSRFGDVFGDLFGNKEPQGGPGADLAVDLPLSFEEAAMGGNKTLTLKLPSACEACRGTGGEGGESAACPACKGAGFVQRRAREHQAFFSLRTACPACAGTGRARRAPCPRCAGEGMEMRPRTIEVTIPPAIEDGTTLRLRGMGAPGANGGPPGDLLTRARVGRHALFEREGLDLKSRATIDLPTALLGGQAAVPLLKGQAEMAVPPGTQPGQQFRLAGQGLKDASGRTGDLLVSVQIEIPRKLSEAQRSLIEQFRSASP